MSRSLFSAVGVLAAGSLVLLFKNYFAEQQELLEKDLLKKIIITLRKRFFSTLREIAFIVNNIRAQQVHFQTKKISQILMKDGGSGDAKLNLIENLTLQSFNTTRKVFEDSCNYYNHNDIQIKLLLQNLKMDIQLALQGTITTYKGPSPNFSTQKVIFIYRELLKRRMHVIQQKLVIQNEMTTNECLGLQFQIQEYLQMEGVKHQKQPNQKVFISILQKKYREDSDFRIQFQNLQLQMEEFMIQIQQRQKTHFAVQGKKQKKKQ